MSIQAHIAALKTLQVVDGRILKMSVLLEEERHNMDEKAARHVALVTKIANYEGVIESMESTRGELHTELRQLNSQIEKSREKMARCRNEREANAAQRELEEIRRLCRDRESEIQKLGGFIEEANAELKQVDGERGEIASQIDETQGAASNKVRALEVSLAEQQDKRVEALGRLTPGMQRRYEAVCNKRGTGSAAVVKGTCTACHIALSPMVYQELMRFTEVHQCPSCMRFLYHQDAISVGDVSEEEDAQAPDPVDSEADSTEASEG